MKDWEINNLRLDFNDGRKKASRQYGLKAVNYLWEESVKDMKKDIDTTEDAENEIKVPYSAFGHVTVRVGFGHHVRVGFCLWAIELTRVVRKIPHFGVRIVWGAIPMSFPVFWISVSGRSLNSYGTSPNLWVQKELVKFRQCTQDTWIRFAKFLGEFLGYPPLNLLGDLGDVILG